MRPLTSDEFLMLVPYFQGIAWGVMSGSQHDHVRREARRMFYLAPRYIALAELGRRHPEELAALVREQIKIAEERYGVENWEAEEG